MILSHHTGPFDSALQIHIYIFSIHKLNKQARAVFEADETNENSSVCFCVSLQSVQLTLPVLTGGLKENRNHMKVRVSLYATFI